ncbi:MAG TPA: hypothetical protein VM099_16440 [Gemmatimonadaceae bacterium]|nr:hypothetical protein [Gemmatimonadaceae bacterium]
MTASATKAFVVLGLVMSGGSSIAAQESRGWAVEGVVGPGDLRELFSDDCCGPTRHSWGTSLGLRARRDIGNRLALGVDGGLTFASHRTMKWLMGVGSIAVANRLMPWAQLGAGLVTQPGECPADGLNYGPGCDTDFTLGAQAAAGLLWHLTEHVGLGGEGAIVRGLDKRATHFTTRRLAATVRLQ